MVDLAIVMVTWNNAQIISAALRSLMDDLEASQLVYDLWLVDCASTDDTVDVIRRGFSNLTLIASQENLGFSRANNLALRGIGFGGRETATNLPPAVYLLNPDTVTHPGAVRTLLETLLSREDVGAVGARLTFGDGSFQHSAFRFPGLGQLWTEFFPTPGRFVEGAFNGRYAQSKYEAHAPFAVDFILGATMMLKREVLLGAGLFDEDFFMYCEEVDWAWRIQRQGWRILCVPQAHVTHLGAQSTAQVRPWSLINLWKSRLLLYDKHYPGWKRRLARQLLIWGMKRKLAQLNVSPNADEEAKSACQTVIEMAIYDPPHRRYPDL